MEQYKLHRDQELVELMRHGDERILMEIYNRYWDKMLAVAFNRLGNQEEAEECVQDVLYKLWKLKDELYLQKANLSHYLARAIRNHAFNILDKRHRANLKSEKYQPLPDINTLSPEQAIIIKELQERIDESINALPAQCRLVFKMSRQDGLSNKEIAQNLSISENTVKSHLKKANKDIQGKLDFLTALLFFCIFFQK